LFIFGVLAVLLAGAVVTVAATSAVMRSGTIAVRVAQSDGSNVALAVPASAARAAIAWVPEEAVGEALGELRRFRPALEAFSREFHRLPDCTFVEVRGPNERIEISKSGDRLVVHVEDGGGTVHVAVPVGTIRAVLARLT